MFVCFILVFLYFVPVTSVYKRWLPNTNFENADNWNVGRIPCGSDVVKFVSGNSLSPTVFVQTNSTLREMWLPMNGEFIFGANSILSFTDSVQDDANCPDAQGELEFIRGPKDWINPDNWCYSQTELGDCQSLPLLESEMIPGLYDDVVFPNQKSFFVSLGVNKNYKLKSLKISGTTLSTDSFSTFVKSADGTRMFPPLVSMSTVTITRKRCKTPTSGCSSGNDQPPILTAICKIYEDRCKRARCNSPLIPLGGCCKMCGVLFNVTIDTGFNITEFTGILQSQFLTGKTGTEMIVSRMSIAEKLIQVVIRDSTGEISSKVAVSIKQDMDKDLSLGGHKYAISSVSFVVSGSPTNNGGTSASTGKLSGGSITGIVLVVIVAIPLVSIIAFYLWSIKTHKRNTVTEKIDGLRNTLGSFRRRASDQQPITEMGQIHSQTSYANQMYGEPLDDRNIQDFNLGLSENQPSTFDKSGFDNPLYSSKGMPSLYSDPSAHSSDL